MVEFCKNSDFDVAVTEAEKREHEFARQLLQDGLKSELKSESFEKWAKRGMLAIEFRSWGKPSGIRVTKAEIWVHELYSPRGRLVCRIAFPVKVLKIIAERAYDKGWYITRAGEDGETSIITIPLWKLCYLLDDL